MKLVRAFDPQSNTASQADYETSRRIINVTETAAMTATKGARARFRRLVAAHVTKLDWSELHLGLFNNAYRIVHWGHEAVTEANLIQAYQAIWVNAEAYQKVFTTTEARQIIGQLKSGLVLLDNSAKVCGFVASWPITQTPEADFAQLVFDPDQAAYLAEWGLTDSSASSPYRGLGLGTFLLTLYVQVLIAAGQQEVILGTAETGYGDHPRNSARPLYEAHGFVPCRHPTGEFITKQVTQRRLDGHLGTHRSLLYLATADRISAALRPEKEAIEGFRFEADSDAEMYSNNLASKPGY
jgi:ribosomal protein S18 acetylase RimI-like enzyme